MINLILNEVNPNPINQMNLNSQNPLPSSVPSQRNDGENALCQTFADVTDSSPTFVRWSELKDIQTYSYNSNAILKKLETSITLPLSSPSTLATTSSPSPNSQTSPSLIHAHSQALQISDDKHTISSNTTHTNTKDTEPAILKNGAILKNRVQSFSELNKSDINELFQYPELLSPNQTNLLRTVQRKRELHPQRYRDDYLRHSSILLLSNGWSSAQRYSMCSVPNLVNRSGQCKLHKFCPYCCFLEKQHALARYVPVYESGIWHFVTGSFTGDLTMNSANDYFDLLLYWDAYKLALQKLVKDKLVRGVFWTEELAVNSIAPTQVLPHIHAMIEADDMSAEAVMELRNMVVANLKSALGPDVLAPNIQVKNINSQRKLLSHLQYQVKPIKIVKAYDFGWQRAVHNDRAGVVMLNSQTTDLVLGYSHVTNRRTKINYAGNLSPKTKCYIGTKDKELKAAQAKVREVMNDGADYIELEDADNMESTLNPNLKDS